MYHIDLRNPWRSYGVTVPKVFRLLNESHFENVYNPAKVIFDGNGSLGNGASMRVVPVPLFYANDYEKMKQVNNMCCLLWAWSWIGVCFL